MRFTSLCFIAILCSYSLFAQSHDMQVPTPFDNLPFYARQVLQRQMAKSDARVVSKTTGWEDRLVGMSTYISGIILDSFSYKYSGDRGSVTINPGADGVTEQWFVDYYKETVTEPDYYTSIPKLEAQILFDSSVHLRFIDTNVLFSTEVRCRTYDTANRVLTSDDYQLYGSGYQIHNDYHYDTDGKLTDFVIKVDTSLVNPNPLVSRFRNFVFYQNGVQIMDSSHSSRFKYTYNAQGLLIEVLAGQWYVNLGTWIDGIAATMTYDNQGRLKTLHSYNGIDSFGYPGSSMLWNYKKNVNQSGYSPVITEAIINSLGLWDTTITRGGLSLDTNGRRAFFYNSNGNLVLVKGFNPANIYTSDVHYYYEAYFSSNNQSNSVTSVPQPGKGLLYPNPSRDVLNLQLPKGAKGGKMQLSILNTAGLTIEDYILEVADVITIPIKELPAGNYIISTAINGQRESYRFSKM